MPNAPVASPAERFARRVFGIAGIYGLVVMLPQYFLEERIGRDNPPAITHPEYFYGFIGVVIAWQLAFLLVAREPRRLRPLMLVAIVEKVSFAIPVLLLNWQGRVAAASVPFAILDLILGALFLVSWLRTADEGEAASWGRAGQAVSG